MRLKHCGQRTCATNPAPTVQPQTASLLVANPFGRSAIAYVNGHTTIIPLRTIAIKYKRPRTTFVDMSNYMLASKGY